MKKHKVIKEYKDGYGNIFTEGTILRLEQSITGFPIYIAKGDIKFLLKNEVEHDREHFEKI